MYSQWDTPSRSSPFSLTPWVRRLIIANAVVYLLMITVFTTRWFPDLFGFRPANALQQPWTFVTYMFLHGGFLHLAFNMLMLFFFGSAVEERMGSSAFVRYYLFCGLGGAALTLLLVMVWPVHAVIGASAAVFGVSLAFAMYWPDAPIFVFPIPVPIKAKWLVIGLATIDLALQLLQVNDGVAHLAHLGGFLFGFLYLKVIPKVTQHAMETAEERTAARVLVHPSAETAEQEGEEHMERSRTTRHTTLDEVDRVLDKISESGIDSLTPDERRLLDEMSKQLRNN